ncbi:hypothetical protein LY76DRAFT_671817 [Colletotrichum caudatum]|nr:hypothetical protein LY76DRAFT_671817 [Colletotrichum caudatum]
MSKGGSNGKQVWSVVQSSNARYLQRFYHHTPAHANVQLISAQDVNAAFAIEPMYRQLRENEIPWPAYWEDGNGDRLKRVLCHSSWKSVRNALDRSEGPEGGEADEDQGEQPPKALQAAVEDEEDGPDNDNDGNDGDDGGGGGDGDGDGDGRVPDGDARDANPDNPSTTIPPTKTPMNQFIPRADRPRASTVPRPASPEPRAPESTKQPSSSTFRPFGTNTYPLRPLSSIPRSLGPSRQTQTGGPGEDAVSDTDERPKVQGGKGNKEKTAGIQGGRDEGGVGGHQSSSTAMGIPTENEQDIVDGKKRRRFGRWWKSLSREEREEILAADRNAEARAVHYDDGIRGIV